VTRTALLLGRAVALLVAGAVVGVAAVALHAWWWGLVLIAVATLVSVYAVRPGWLTRLPYAVGWLAACGLGMIPRPAGSYAVASDGAGYTLIGIGLAAIVLTTATLPMDWLRGRTAVSATDSGPDSEPESGPTSGTA
jgi:hypothetical protein